MAIEKLTGIVIDTIRHNDRNNVVTLFTREKGRVSFLSPASGGKRGKNRNARLLPLSIIETNVNFKESRDLQHLGQISLLDIHNELYFNPVKSTIVFFLSEFLNKYLRTASPDIAAFDFVRTSLRILDELSYGVANFHLYFLINFLGIAGITPDLTDFEKGDWFDMRLGETVAMRPMHSDFLNPEQTAILPNLFRMTRRNLNKFKFSASGRNEILKMILKYYSIFFPGISDLKSPQILSEIFSK